MRSERLWFSFFILLALTLNFGFVYGDINTPDHHHKFELFFAFLVSLISTIIKFGDRTHMGSLLLATSLVADLQLLLAILVWTFSVGALDGNKMSMIVSFAAGALVANLISVILMVIEAASLRR